MSSFVPVERPACFIPFCFQRITRRQGGGDEAYYTYVEEADDDANKVSQRPEAHPTGERIGNDVFTLPASYHLQGGNLQANWYPRIRFYDSKKN